MVFGNKWIFFGERILVFEILDIYNFDKFLKFNCVLVWGSEGSDVKIL